ncbi:hypothetical protein L208DRAFT_413703 [Tricholoma matsutake]|nr:hypothetical protein L208DRAFT_413703 [Tricholoma matsutake 945]
MGGLPHHSPLSPICLVPVNLSKNCFRRPYGWSLESRGRCEQGKTDMKKSLAPRVSEGTWWEEKNLEEKALSRATRQTRMHVVFAGDGCVYMWTSMRCVCAFTKLCKQEFDGNLFYSTFDTLASICFELLRINLI